MKTSGILLTCATVMAAAVLGYSSLASAAPASVTHGGKTYYKVTSTDPKMDSGDEVCASIGKKCAGFAQANNAVCKLFNPGAKTLTSVNGSKYDFYCNGAPQTGLACGKMMNTCQTCPACNPNNTCSSPIGNLYREMYVECTGGTTGSNSKSAGPAKLPVAPKVSSSSKSSQPSGITCAYTQPPKRVSCTVYKAGDTFCAMVMGSVAAKATLCQDTGKVVCTMPCTAYGAQTFRLCGANGVKSGSCAASSTSKPATPKKPAGQLCANGAECQTGYCLGVVPGKEYRCSGKQLTYTTFGCSSSSSLPAKNRDPGQLCDNGGQCKSGMCLGVVPGREYRCSCIGSQSKWQNCPVTSSSSLPATNRKAGQTCQHGGQCASGMCLGVIPGQLYQCSCMDPKTRVNNCVK
jgi:hypothetical protein